MIWLSDKKKVSVWARWGVSSDSVPCYWNPEERNFRCLLTIDRKIRQKSKLLASVEWSNKSCNNCVSNPPIFYAEIYQSNPSYRCVQNKSFLRRLKGHSHEKRGCNLGMYQSMYLTLILWLIPIPKAPYCS
jgi:hypothetical protein